jgi:hypothetical protein
MPGPHLIGPVPASSEKTPSARRRRALPADLLRDASRRLAIMSVVACGLWSLGTVLGHLAASATSHADAGWAGVGVPDAIAAFGVLVSLVLFLYTRSGRRDPKRVLDLGRIYLVFTALALGLTFHWDTVPGPRSVVPEISWIGAVVLMFAAIVPSTPLQTLLSGLLAVSMSPVSMLFARARGFGASTRPATRCSCTSPTTSFSGSLSSSHMWSPA